MSVTGEPGGNPVKCGHPDRRPLGRAVLRRRRSSRALHARERTGAGQRIDTSLFEGALALSIWETAELWATGRVPRPLGSAHRLTAPYQALRTRDGHITVGGNNQKLWERLCAAIGRAGAASTTRASPPTTTGWRNRRRAGRRARGGARRARHRRVGRRAARGRRPRAGRSTTTRRCSPTRTRRRARWWSRWSTRRGGTVRGLGIPVKLSATPGAIRRPAPLLGQHTDEILREAGFATTRSGAVSVDVRAPRPGRVGHVRPPRGAQRDDVRDVRGARSTHCETRRRRRRRPRRWSCAARAARRSWPAPTSASSRDVRDPREDGARATRPRSTACSAGWRPCASRPSRSSTASRWAAGWRSPAACDLRVCTPGAKFGMPIARTVGNCLSMANYARLAALLGAGAAEGHRSSPRAPIERRGGAGDRLRDRGRRATPRRASTELCELLAAHAADDAAGDQGGAAPRARRARRRRPRPRGLRQRGLPPQRAAFLARSADRD